MPQRRQDAETPLRDEISQLRADIDSLVGTVGRLADGAASSFTHEAKRAWTDVGSRAEDAYDTALAQGRRTLRGTEKTIQSHPFLSLALAAGLGLLLGKLISR